jgi:hypothetical protein
VGALPGAERDEIRDGGHTEPWSTTAWPRSAASGKSLVVPIALVHRITIFTALAGALAYTAWALWQPDLRAAAGGLVATAVIAAYLRNLRARLDRKLGSGDRA